MTFPGGAGTSGVGWTDRGSALCVFVGHVRQNPQRGEAPRPPASEGTLQPGQQENVSTNTWRRRAFNTLLSRPCLRSSLGTSRWLTKDELEALLVESISPHDVRALPVVRRHTQRTGSAGSSAVPAPPPQYARFLQLMERLLSLPQCASEEEFVLHHRRQLEDQSKKQAVPPLQQDERGVAFSAADGKSSDQNRR